MTPGTFLTSWRLDPIPLAMTLSAGALYLAGARRVWRTRGRAAFPPPRAGFFFAGLAVVLVALESPVHAYADRVLSVHMAQHLLLTMVAAPLLVLGAPSILALQASTPAFRHRWLRPLLRSWPVRVLTARVVSWAQFAL